MKPTIQLAIPTIPLAIMASCIVFGCVHTMTTDKMADIHVFHLKG